MEDGMVPVLGEKLLDGDYAVMVDSSSSMFRIVEAVLHVLDGELTATITMSGTSYLYVYPGTAAEAVIADESAWVGYTEDSEGRYCFTIPRWKRWMQVFPVPHTVRIRISGMTVPCSSGRTLCLLRPFRMDSSSRRRACSLPTASISLMSLSAAAAGKRS